MADAQFAQLFQIVQPGIALFGKKDYQQCIVVRNMVEQFNMPIQVIGGETVRADSGLALSSRNGYLSEAERTEAAALSAQLRRLAQAVHAGGYAPAAIAAGTAVRFEPGLAREVSLVPLAGHRLVPGLAIGGTEALDAH